jgi:small-conductance mechanosensitive channel
MNASSDSLSGILGYRFGFGDISVSVGGVVGAGLTLVLVWVLSRVISRAFDRHAAQRDVRTRAAIYTISRLAKYGLYTVGALLALGFLGIPTSRFAVLAGAVGVGLGFGLQAIFSNFVSGIILLFERSLRVGDFVELESGLHGEVRDINIRATLISTNDNIDILVPNSEFVTGRVVNWTHGEVTRRLRIPFGVAYGTDKELVKKAALEAAAEVPFTIALEGPRKPQVWLVEFGESSLGFELVVWLTADATKRPSAVRAAYTWALETALCKYSIEIPYPQRDLNVRSVFGLRGESALAWLPSAEAASGPLARHDVATDGAAHSPAQADARRPTRLGAQPVDDRAEPAVHETHALDERERARLARNDALEEVERAAREDDERREAEEREAAECLPAERERPGG